MLIQYVAIGSEVLEGITLNTNSYFVSKKLAQIGFALSRHVVIADEKQAMITTMQDAIENYTITLFSGGLGPTCDDLTKEIVSKVVGKPLKFNPDLYEKLKRRYPNLDTIENQAKQIEDAIFFENLLGTAYGFAVEKNQSLLIFLPGVPQELEDLLERQVMPWLKREFSSKLLFEKKYVVILKKEHEVDPFLRKLQEIEKNLHVGIYPNYGYLTVYFSSENEDSMQNVKEQFEQEFHTYIMEEDSLAEGLLKLLENENLTIAFAESCTGGKVSELITAVPGASRSFLGSVVAYSNYAKQKILNVQESTLKQFGAVSEACAIELSAGLKEKFEASISASVTGIAGPDGGSMEKPIGTVYYSFIIDREIISGKIPLMAVNKRAIIISYVANYLLASIYRYVKFQIFPNNESKI